MRVIFIILSVFIVGIGLAVAPLAVLGTTPTPPASYYGTVYIEGEPAPAGTVITAYMNGSVVGSITTDTNGSFGGPGTFDEKLDVNGSDDQVGELVRFEVGNETANTTLEWEPGDHRRLTLGTVKCSALAAGLEAPTDPDGDGDFEDTNGNGRLDFHDVVTLFDHISSASTDCHDFNGNGRIDFDDVVKLFEEV